MMLAALLLSLVQAEPAEEPPRKMLYAQLQAECGKLFDARRKDVAALKTPEDVKKRQDRLREKFVEAIGGYPERTPLKARTVGTVKGDGFTVEKVIYESRPDHHVSALFYLPEGKGPFPGVLVPCGHSDKGKAEEAYQRICILLARNGLAVLCYDPIGQGERMQLLTPEGRPAIKGNTTEHTMSGIGALLVGWSCASFRIWDGIRSLDYLAGRPEIDAKRLGCTGNSGGGTMTAYLMALDDRIAAAAPSCYVTTLERLFTTIGPQDAEQNITGQVAFGMEQTDFVTMRAPKPTLMCTATQDFFDIQGCWTTFREAKQIYGMLGHAERMDLIEYNDKHGFSRPRREASMRWMRRWLLGIDDAPVEGEWSVFKEEDLRCTSTGQVLSELKGKSVFDLDLERERSLESARAGLSKDERRERVVRRIAFGPKAPGRRSGETLLVEPGIRLPLAADRTAWVTLTKDGKSYGLDLRGWGATAPEGNSPFGSDWKEAFLGIHLARPLVGQRAADLLAANEALGGDCAWTARGPAALVALHAAVVLPGDSEITLEGGLVSWSSVLRTPVTKDPLSSVVPGALQDYDLPDLAALIAPRKLTIKAPVDGAGKPVSQAELESAYAKAREAYKSAGAERNLVLQAAP